MKKAAKMICPAIFLIICILVIQFLHLFTVTNVEMTYIDFSESVQILEDGTEIPYDNTETYSNEGGITGTYRFTGEIPAGIGNGNLIFEISGMDCALYINDEEVYSSSAPSPATVAMGQAYIPFEGSTAAEVTLICTLNGDAGAMFPPMLRFMPEGFTEAQATAIADVYALSSGAAATALIVVCALFLLGITNGKPDFSLIPLALAVFMLMAHRIIQGLGYYFLPQGIVEFFSDSRTGWITVAALVLYLLMNRKRDFWKYMAIATGVSAVALLIVYLISLAVDGSISVYLNVAVPALFNTGVYDGLLYWFTFWLAGVSALISAYRVMHQFAAQRANQKTLELKNELIMSSYHAIESKMRASNEYRHEWRHQIAALKALYNKKDFDGIGEMLKKLSDQAENAMNIKFSDNFTVNAILQDCSIRAEKNGIKLEATAALPQEIDVSEIDLCTLLMNMLDNAVEASEKVENGSEKFIKFKAEIRNGFLAIRCENSYAGNIITGKNNIPITTKSNKAEHGFGTVQMEAVAKKYNSVLDISHDNEKHIFTVQTALKLPEQNK